MRYGLRSFWAAGLPWKLIHEAIDAMFNYKLTDDAMNNWETSTGRKFDNVQDLMTKYLKCPKCSQLHSVPWTTCGYPRDLKQKTLDLVGEGFGDGKFSFRCETGNCTAVLTPS